MQTFLYVLGPFMLWCGAGLACLLVGVSVIYHVLIPYARLQNARRRELEGTYDYANQAHDFICDLVVELDRNQILEDATPNRLQVQANVLNRPIRQKELTP